MANLRKKTTVYLDPDLLRAVKVLAALTGRHDYQVFEEALQTYLEGASAETSRQALRGLLDREDQSRLSDDQALDLAYRESHEARRGHDRN